MQAETERQRMKELFKKGGPNGSTHLAEVRDWILSTARECLGTWKPRKGICRPFMSVPGIREILRRRQKAWKALAKSCQRGSSPPVIAAKQREHVATCRKWSAARQEAEAKVRQAALDRTVEACEEPGVQTRRLFREFARAREAASPRKNSKPTFDIEQAAHFWQEQYTSTVEDDVRSWPPYCQVDLVITAEQVKEAISKMRRSSPGPDGMDFLVFEVFEEELAPILAAAFTRAVREGLPDALREGRMVLTPKTNPPPSCPSGYRPLNIMDMIIRLMYKALQILFGEEVRRRKPNEGGLHRCQAGFVQERNGYEQVFALQLVQAVRRECSSPKKFLAGILLDIAKAFDSLEHSVILRTLQKRGYPEVWLEIFRRLLPGNRANLLGRVIHLERGSPQGGALSPLLCILVLDELAQDLLERIRRDPELWDLWRQGSTQREHHWGLDWSPTLRLWLMLLMYADDITVLAGSPEAARRLLLIIGQWASDLRLVISPKSLLVLLSTAGGRNEFRDGVGDDPLSVGSVTLQWQAEQAFQLLGVRCQMAFSHRLHHPVLAMDINKARRVMGTVMATFTMGPWRYVSPPALKQGIEQLVYTTMLYEATVVDIDCSGLESLVLDRCRHILNLQPTTPSAYILWELRLWPPWLRAHKRAMVFAAFILHHSWIGKYILKPLLEEDKRRERSLQDLHPIFSIGPLLRITKILQEYNKSWLTVLHEWSQPWKDRKRVADTIQQTLLLPRYVKHLRWKILEGSKGIPASHRQQLLRDMELPDKINKESAQLMPLYQYLPQDLPRAGMVFRAPYLRHQYRDPFMLRASCIWCGELEGECGYHLLRCPQPPARIAALRDRALRATYEDYKPGRRAEGTAHLREENLHRLFQLRWWGHSNWRRTRKDRDHQPGLAALRTVLLYMRETINTYASQVPEIWELPTYAAAPPTTAEEEAMAQQLWQDTIEEEGDEFVGPSQDSLQFLGGIDDN